MRIALLADLHANREAVDACLRRLDALGHDRLVVLGDLVGYGADPAWVVDAVREAQSRGAIVVRGTRASGRDGRLCSNVGCDTTPLSRTRRLY